MLFTRQASRGGRFGPARPEPVFGDPIHLTETSTVQPGGVGTLTGFPLRPPAKRPFFMSAIKFQIQPSTVGSLNGVVGAGSLIGGSSFDLGAVVSVTFTLVKYSTPIGGGLEQPMPEQAYGLFSNRVPITALCDSRDASSALLTGGSSAGAGATFTASHPISEYRWDLPVPFEVPSGYMLVPQFYNSGQNIGQLGGTLSAIPALQVQVSYEGSLLYTDHDGYDDYETYPGGEIHVPFAAAFIAPQQKLTTALPAFSAISDETSLFNAFDQSVIVTQFNGKIITLPALTDIASDLGETLQVRLMLGDHFPIVRDFASFRTVFSRESRAWALPTEGAGIFELNPGSYVDTTLSGAVTLGASVATTIQPIIGMTGYRKIRREVFMGGA